MIISRLLAKRRIARGEHPSWGAAWVPVMADAVCLILVFILLYRPFVGLIDTFDAPTWAIIAALLALGFIPIQAVLVFSSLWAAKSRWTETETDG